MIFLSYDLYLASALIEPSKLAERLPATRRHPSTARSARGISGLAGRLGAPIHEHPLSKGLAMYFLHRSAWAIVAMCGTAADAGMLPSFKGVTEALAQGKQVTVALDLAQCRQPGGKAGPAIRAGMPITSYMNLGTRLVFSDPHFTVPPQGGWPEIEFVRYQLSNQDSLTLTKTVFKLPGYEQVRLKTFTCALGQGVTFFD